MSEKNFNRAAAVILVVVGVCALLIPELVYYLIIIAAIVAMGFTALTKLISGLTRGNVSDLISALISAVFCIILCFYNLLPMRIVQIVFGIYCIVSALAIAIQQILYIYNNAKGSLFQWLLSFGYALVGLVILFSPEMTDELLLKMVGIYMILLGFRFWQDASDSDTARWRGGIHLSLPTAIAAFIPSMYLDRINAHFNKVKENRTVPVVRDPNEDLPLKVMVHTGEAGAAVVGHITFVWKGVVYSYGNYDASSLKLFGTLGDGVLFTVPFERYLPSLNRYEKNTVFEYGIRTTPEQEEAIERELKKLKDNTYRWFCKIEDTEEVKMQFQKFSSEYAVRLHYRTGAKFYKFKTGVYKNYWLLGENCARFANRFLGCIGTDVLSIRGVITPGAYFDYLKNEYLKENSPVVYCMIHPREREDGQQEEAAEILKQDPKPAKA